VRLHQPGGPSPRIYIPHEHGSPVIPPGTGSLFSPLTTRRWRYSNPPLHGLWLSSQNQSQSYFTTDGQWVSMSWCRLSLVKTLQGLNRKHCSSLLLRKTIVCETVAQKLLHFSCLFGGRCLSPVRIALQTISSQPTKTPWSESASELHRPNGRSLSAKLVPTFLDRGCRVFSGTRNYG
jgi:hypothetical protein